MHTHSFDGSRPGIVPVTVASAITQTQYMRLLPQAQGLMQRTPWEQTLTTLLPDPCKLRLFMFWAGDS